MEETACDEESSIESEFAATIKYIDLYLRQKTDLFLQHYVFEPFDFLAKKLVYLSVLVTLLVAGTLVLLAGVILLIATVVPLWAALLITGIHHLSRGRHNRVRALLEQDHPADPDGHGDDEPWKNVGR